VIAGSLPRSLWNKPLPSRSHPRSGSGAGSLGFSSADANSILGFVNSIAAAAVVVALFFAGYFVAYEPYRALYPDGIVSSVNRPASARDARVGMKLADLIARLVATAKR